MISPIPLYLDKSDIQRLIGVLSGYLDDMKSDDIIIISQSIDLEELHISLWDHGFENQHKVIYIRQK